MTKKTNVFDHEVAAMNIGGMFLSGRINEALSLVESLSVVDAFVVGIRLREWSHGIFPSEVVGYAERRSDRQRRRIARTQEGKGE